MDTRRNKARIVIEKMLADMADASYVVADALDCALEKAAHVAVAVSKDRFSLYLILLSASIALILFFETSVL